MAYTTEASVVQHSGIGKLVTNEAVGSGDTVETVFYLDIGQTGTTIFGGKLVDNTQTIYLDGVAQAETTDYTIDNITGKITFTSAPGSSVAITADYTYLPAELPLKSTDLTQFITEAEAEVIALTGKDYNTSQTETEYQDGRETVDFTRDEDPYGPDYIILSKIPVLAITSLEFLAKDGSVDTTVTDYWTDLAIGKITLKDDVIPNGTRNIKIVYTYGASTVPSLVAQLTSYYAALRAIAALMGSSYDDVTSYSLGAKSVAIGESWVNIQQVVKTINAEVARILPLVGVTHDPVFT